MSTTVDKIGAIMVSQRQSTNRRNIGNYAVEERIYKHDDGRCTIVLARYPFDQLMMGDGTINRVCQCEYDGTPETEKSARESVEELFREWYGIMDELAGLPHS